MGRFREDRRGVAVMEFALVGPLLFLLVFGAAEFSIMLGEYMTLSNAAVVGAKQLANSAGVDGTPYTDAVAAIKTAASTMNLTGTNIALSVNGTACTADAACSTSLSAGTGYVTATLTYSCTNLNIVYNLLPNCSLSAQQTERVQ